MSIKNPMNDDDYTGNDEQIADLKARVETLETALGDAINALNMVPSFRIGHPEDPRFTSYKLIPLLDKVLKG